MKSITGFTLSLFIIFVTSFFIARSLGFLEDSIVTNWLNNIKNSPGGLILLSVSSAGLLIADLFLPVPSSLLMMLSGFFTGLFWGSVINIVGSVGSAALGFWLCRILGKNFFEKITGKKDVERIKHFFDSHGIWAILLSRSVPLLTEVISCLAGLSPMLFRKFIIYTSCATIPVCIVYAYLGSLGQKNISNIGMPVIIALLLPGIGFGVYLLVNIKSKNRLKAD